MRKFDQLIITAAICGAEITRKETPYLPITPEELSEEAKRCYEAGASIVHLHVRDAEGNPTQDAAIFKQTVQLIRQKAPKLIVQVSTGGATWMKAHERVQSIESEPDMATLSTGSCNFGDDLFLNSKSMVMEFAKQMQERSIMPEFECFEIGHIHFANWLVQKGHVIWPHYHYDFVMGVPGAIAASVPLMVRMREEIPGEASWTVAGIGRMEIPMAAAAIAMGGNVRVGMEDNLYISKGVLAKSNAELVEKVVRIAKEIGRPIAVSDEVREYFRLKKKDS
ncbi:MAG TPA: 3-keto-5-aminohexanoate cleavage protein [Thermotogota bacterium]|nr:3-keto-5-aminohexanoate cleavage protein [Thermotogota bacterium]